MGTLTDINKLVTMLRTIEEDRKQFDLVQKIHEKYLKTPSIPQITDFHSKC
jgi:hypothetical protein